MAEVCTVAVDGAWQAAEHTEGSSYKPHKPMIANPSSSWGEAERRRHTRGVRRWLLSAVLLAFLCCAAGQDDARPLIICVKYNNVSMMARCPEPGLRLASTDKDASVFSGYDPDVWRLVARDMGVDNFYWYCIPEFGRMINTLSGGREGFHCDVGVTGITHTVERENSGIRFSYPTYHARLAVLYHAPLKSGSIWGFLHPFDWSVWLAMLGTALVIPLIVYVLETIGSGRCRYCRDKADVRGLKEALWHGIAHIVHLEYFIVHSLPARVVVLAYGFTVLIFLETYTANLAAFLTVNQLDSIIGAVSDLRGKTVVTAPSYQERLIRWGIIASVDEGFDQESMVSGVTSGLYSAMIYDDFVIETFDGKSCNLRMLDQKFEPFSIAMAFHPSVNQSFINGTSTNILAAQENGELERLYQNHFHTTDDGCMEPGEASETAAISLHNIGGLWVILLIALGVALILVAMKQLMPRQKESKSLERLQKLKAVTAAISSFRQAGADRMHREEASNRGSALRSSIGYGEHKKGGSSREYDCFDPGSCGSAGDLDDAELGLALAAVRPTGRPARSSLKQSSSSAQQRWTRATAQSVEMSRTSSNVRFNLEAAEDDGENVDSRRSPSGGAAARAVRPVGSAAEAAALLDMMEALQKQVQQVATRISRLAEEQDCCADGQRRCAAEQGLEMRPRSSLRHARLSSGSLAAKLGAAAEAAVEEGGGAPESCDGEELEEEVLPMAPNLALLLADGGPKPAVQADEQPRLDSGGSGKRSLHCWDSTLSDGGLRDRHGAAQVELEGTGKEPRDRTCERNGSGGGGDVDGDEERDAAAQED